MQEIIVIALLVLVFFGGKKIPELMKGIGGGVKSFRDALEGKDDSQHSNDSSNSANETTDKPRQD